MVLSSYIHGWLYLVPLIPSILVAILVLYHSLNSRVLRTALNNHVIILLLSCGLIENLTDIIWCIDYYWTGFALSPTPAFCVTWIFMSSTLYVAVSILTAWVSIERHILIFHSNWLGTKIKCFFFHYLPLAVCIMWPSVFYFVMFIIVPCSVKFNF